VWHLDLPEKGFFTAEERAQVEALFDAIFPGGEDAPSASDAGAAEYLDRFLAIDPKSYYEIAGWRAQYKKALPALAGAAQAAHGAKLEELEPEQVTELMSRLAAGTLSPFPADIDQKALFAMIRNHTIEGCFADPRWGGNRDRVVWRWYGYLQPAELLERAEAAAR
jgi:gluconate 2-dehydrogenase gamma chain